MDRESSILAAAVALARGRRICPRLLRGGLSAGAGNAADVSRRFPVIFLNRENDLRVIVCARNQALRWQYSPCYCKHTSFLG
jgi:hypothetical protein